MIDDLSSVCEYCGHKKELREKTIIFRDIDRFTGKKFVNQRVTKVCKEGSCGAYLQMAHEG